MKKLFTFLLALVAGVSAIYASNTKVDGIYYNFDNTNKTATVTYRGSSYDDYPDEYSGSVVIPSSVTYGSTTYIVTSIGERAFQYCRSLTSITIPNSVTSIGDHAFAYCSSLTSVTIGNSVTSIGDHAFAYCSSLTSVTIGNSVTSLGSYAFSGCSSLTSVTIPNSVTSIGRGVFYECSSLRSVTIPNSVTSIGDYAFRDCSSLTSVTIPNSVTSIGDYAFERCASLTSITIPNSVTSIGDEAFYGCSSLTSITIGNSVTSIGNYAFAGCSSLTSINVDANNSKYSSVDGVLFNKDKTTLITYPVGKQGAYTIPNSVTKIGYEAFRGCSFLTSVTIPNGVTSIGKYAFAYCSSLTSVTIGNSVTSIGNDAFCECSSLTSVTIGNSVTSIGEYAFNRCYSLTSVTIPNSVTSIGERAFLFCSSLTSITIPNSVTSIGESAFYECPKLTSVTLTASSEEDFCKGQGNSLLYSEVVRCQREIQINGTKVTKFTIPNGVTSIGAAAFYYCSSLTSITIPNSVTSIGKSAFYECPKLTSVTLTASSEEDFCKGQGNSLLYSEGVRCQREIQINGTKVTKFTIPNGVTSIGVAAFYYCSSLTSITIGNSVTSIESSAFEGCSNITSVIWNAKNCNSYNFGRQVTSFEFGNEVEVVPSSLCKGMEKLTSITIPNSVTSIGSEAFYGCSNITSVIWNAKNCNSYNFGSQVASFEFGNEVEVVPSSLCKGMEKLTSITIPNSVKTIGASAFKGCIRLGKVSLGKNLETIGANAFAECTRLYDIYVYATYPPFAEESSFANYNVYVYIPCEYQRDYTLDVVWGKFRFIECISSDNVTTDEIVVTPSENEANVIWPTVSGAASYELVIKDKDGNIVCTLIFNANGQLTSIAFNAPSRNGVPAQTQSAGFSFTITGLDSGTGYDLTLTAKDDSGNTIEETTIPFHTDYPEGIENVHGDEVQSIKVIKDGQVLILRNDKTYTMQGQEVK